MTTKVDYSQSTTKVNLNVGLDLPFQLGYSDDHCRASFIVKQDSLDCPEAKVN